MPKQSWVRSVSNQSAGDSHTPGSRLPLLTTRPAATFRAAGHHRPEATTKLYCLVTGTQVWITCPRLSHSGARRESIPLPVGRKSDLYKERGHDTCQETRTDDFLTVGLALCILPPNVKSIYSQELGHSHSSRAHSTRRASAEDDAHNWLETTTLDR